MDIRNTAVRFISNKWMSYCLAVFAFTTTAFFLVFLAAPLLLSDDPIGTIYNPTNQFLLDSVYLGACNWALLLASGSWATYYAPRKKAVSWFWLAVLAANTVLYLFLHQSKTE